MAKISNHRPSGLFNVAYSRRKTIHELLGDRESISILELGPLDNPTFLASEGDVFYFDIASKDELKTKHASRQTDRMVDVDYVLKEGCTITDSIDRQFDLIVANHVVEHTPNLIEWLTQMDRLTVTTGCLFLSVPDKRFTFDYYRQPTDAVELVRAYEEKLVKPAWHQIARIKYYEAKQINAVDIWNGVVPGKFTPSESLSAIIERSKKASLSRYYDVHCWVFTEDSFERLILDLHAGGYTNWTITGCQPVLKNDNEFRVLLRKNQRHE